MASPRTSLLSGLGAPLDKIERILTHGFAVPPSPSNGRALGHGVYLAGSPAMDAIQFYAKPAEDGHRHLLLCQIYAQRLEETPEPTSLKNALAVSGRFLSVETRGRKQRKRGRDTAPIRLREKHVKGAQEG